jgi:branched-chain amino acid transport system ATP-binding protein
VEAVLERFPVLASRRAQMAGTLSGGERQMLGIGRALVAAPRAMLLDEPSFGLAPKAVEAVFEVVAGLSQEGMAVLLIEQNARRALDISSRALVLERGVVRMTGSSRELKESAGVVEAYLGGKQAEAVEQAAEEVAHAR